MWSLLKPSGIKRSQNNRESNIIVHLKRPIYQKISCSLKLKFKYANFYINLEPNSITKLLNINCMLICVINDNLHLVHHVKLQMHCINTINNIKQQQQNEVLNNKKQLKTTFYIIRQIRSLHYFAL